MRLFAAYLLTTRPNGVSNPARHRKIHRQERATDTCLWILSYLVVAIKMKRRGGVFFTFKFSKAMATTAEISALSKRVTSLIHLLAHCENITPATIQVVDDLYIDALISAQRDIVETVAGQMRNALLKAAERIVVLESLLESERKLRQDDRAFALKNATHL